MCCLCKNRGGNSDNFNVFFFLPDLRVTDFRFPDVHMNQGPVDAFSDQTSPTSLNLPITTSGDMVTFFHERLSATPELPLNLVLDDVPELEYSNAHYICS